jgi:transcription termination factor Rho
VPRKIKLTISTCYTFYLQKSDKVRRKIMATMQSVEAIEFISDKLKETKNNNEFFDAMRR